MTTGAKITLSAKELELVKNTDWILTKHAVIQKVYELMGQVSEQMKALVEKSDSSFPAEVIDTFPKISKGENYRLLPWVMLDYPRFFSKEDVLAIRTFFWWGNFFSVNLHASGNYKDAVMKKLEERFEFFQQQGYAVCVGNDPWQHHFEKDNFIMLDQLSQEAFRSIMANQIFLKLAKKKALHEWNEVPEFIIMTFTELSQLCSDHAPSL